MCLVLVQDHFFSIIPSNRRHDISPSSSTPDPVFDDQLHISSISQWFSTASNSRNVYEIMAKPECSSLYLFSGNPLKNFLTSSKFRGTGLKTWPKSIFKCIKVMKRPAKVWRKTLSTLCYKFRKGPLLMQLALSSVWLCLDN